MEKCRLYRDLAHVLTGDTSPLVLRTYHVAVICSEYAVRARNELAGGGKYNSDRWPANRYDRDGNPDRYGLPRAPGPPFSSLLTGQANASEYCIER